MTFMLPERVQQAIAAYREEVESSRATVDRVKQQTADLKAELERTKADLDAAIDASIKSPTAANARKESELRKKVAELQVDLDGGAARERRASALGFQRERELAQAAIKVGREEAERYYNEHYNAALQKIADAKYAYLSACVDYYRLQRQANGIYEEAVTQTNPNYAQPVSRPSLKTEYFFYRGGDRQIYGVSELEVMRATRNGKILKNSCPEGKAIE